MRRYREDALGQRSLRTLELWDVRGMGAPKRRRGTQPYQPEFPRSPLLAMTYIKCPREDLNLHGPKPTRS